MDRFFDGFLGRIFDGFCDGFFARFKSNFATDVTADFVTVFTADFMAQTSVNVNFPPTYLVIFVKDFTFEINFALPNGKIP